MNATKKLDPMLERIAWSALFIWWGLSFIPGFLPNGLDAAGTGVILLGVNAIRLAKGSRVNGFSATVGILCLVWGGLDMMRSVFQLPYKPPVFAILLIVLGAIVLVSLFLKSRTPTTGAGGQNA
jgi:hypothetical protein